MLSPPRTRFDPAEESFTASSANITPERRKMNRELSYYGPLFPTTPAPGMKEDEERTPLLAQLPSPEVLAHLSIKPNDVKIDIDAFPDTPLTVDQLHAPDSTYTIVRPLTEKYSALQNHSISGWSERTLPLASLLLTPWALFQGASEVVMAKIIEEDGDDDALVDLAGNALEMAIIGNSKRFIRSPSAQKVIGTLTLTQAIIVVIRLTPRPKQRVSGAGGSFIMLSTSTPSSQMLKVPRIRSILEYFNFAVLFVLYVLAIEGLNTDAVNWRECLFIVYAMGFSLDKLAAMREHGLRGTRSVFAANLWNGFDLGFIVIYLTYLTFRIYGLKHNDEWAKDFSTDVLAIGAVGMFPRLAFVTLSNNLMILSLRSMMGEFISAYLLIIASLKRLFTYALWTLGRGRYQFSQIGWYLLEVYFGLDASGFEAAHDFHRYLGPILMISFACLSNTLLLTVLVAILSNTFATINADAAAESMFRKAVSTLEGVKGDSVFSYQLPFNLLAVVTMWPLSFMLSPRWFHKVNVFMIRATSFPILLAIAIYERQKFHHTSISDWVEKQLEKYCGSAPRRIKNALMDSAGFDSFAGAGKDIDIVFEVEREVGDYYAGWDDDGDMDGDRDDADTVLTGSSSDEDDETTIKPIIKPSQPIQITESPSRPSVEPRDDHPEQSQPEGAPIPMPRSKTIDSPISPPPAPQASSGRQRRQSSPAPSKIVGCSSLAAEGLPLRRRRDSIMEPSPLARLFVRSPTEESGFPIGSRRQAGSLSMSLAHPSHLAPYNFSERVRQRRQSLTPIDTFTLGTKHPMGPIKEGQPTSFVERRKGSPGEEVAPPEDKVAKATAVENAQATGQSPEINGRLSVIEDRQKRIEDLLQQLVRTAEAKFTGPPSRGEIRRESEISLDM
ncbi:hypothetical protein QFC21_002269 [Naganishia friedmannii]|uniref:Uncharacterized protein n=1 Tax=Naganishia friedmannii TaxID=89922 RepID=A0ACC2VWV1_9TREE|nr:hypothetical protein QFC21_002269 [Naganishia friedmannii]